MLVFQRKSLSRALRIRFSSGILEETCGNRSHPCRWQEGIRKGEATQKEILRRST